LKGLEGKRERERDREDAKRKERWVGTHHYQSLQLSLAPPTHPKRKKGVAGSTIAATPIRNQLK